MFFMYFLFFLVVARCCGEKGTGLDDCRNGRHNNVHYINDRPTHCIIHNVNYRNGLCMSIELLYQKLSTLFNTKPQRVRDADRTREFKRYLLQHRALIYNKRDEFDDNSGVHEKNGFNTLFMKAAQLFTETHPETHQIVKNQTSLGVEVFCDMALRQFPVANNRLYNILPPEECPAPASKCYIDKGSRSATTSSNRYPRHVNLVWYSNGYSPEKCYVPTKLIDVEPDPDRCITFPVAIEMLNTKDNGSPTPRKNDYLAETSLGYQDDPTILVNITSRKSHQPALETVNLSVHAFCAALVEIIPFSKDEIRRGLSIRVGEHRGGGDYRAASINADSNLGGDVGDNGGDDVSVYVLNPALQDPVVRGRPQGHAATDVVAMLVIETIDVETVEEVDAAVPAALATINGVGNTFGEEGVKNAVDNFIVNGMGRTLASVNKNDLGVSADLGGGGIGAGKGFRGGHCICWGIGVNFRDRALIYNNRDEYDDNSGVHEKDGFNTLFMKAGKLHRIVYQT
uniref:Uncharacterized protein n=1 Tax=Romanomermis culicivorax TaxID=13658 RepID=A0A915JMC5_ROMCU